MDLMARRRVMMLAAEEAGPPTPYGNAITAATAAWYETPVTMPLTSRVIIDCWINLTGNTSGGTDYQFFDFSATNTFFGRRSSDRALRYRYYGDAYEIAAAIGDNTVKRIDFKPKSRIFTLTYTDDTTANSNNPGRAWTAKNTPLRMQLRPNFFVQHIQQINSGDVLAHDLIPAMAGSTVGMLDTVDNTFCPYNDGNAFITTI